MKTNSQFVIPFKGLKTGKYDFVFDIDDKFFEVFEESEVKKGKVHVEVELDKKETMLELFFSLSGTVIIPCDRCLDDLELPVEHETELFVKFGDQTEEQTEEILVLLHSEFELDITQYIYEFVHLSLPYKRVHPDKKGKSTCNKEMLKKLEEYIIHENDNDNDPRWDGLKNLLNN